MATYNMLPTVNRRQHTSINSINREKEGKERGEGTRGRKEEKGRGEGKRGRKEDV